MAKDAETKAVQICTKAIEPLEQHARGRVINYLAARFVKDPENLEFIRALTAALDQTNAERDALAAERAALVQRPSPGAETPTT